MPPAVSQANLSACQINMVRTFVLSRLLITFAVIPALCQIWSPQSQQQQSNEWFVTRSIKMLENFDARQFRHLQSHGYQIDPNHAFYPLLPLLMPCSVVGTFLLQQAIALANSLLILNLGVYKFKLDLKQAQLAAYFYIVSHSLVYQSSLYSENLFLFFSLIGIYILHVHIDFLPFATLAFGLASMTRSTGVLLSIPVLYSLAKRLLRDTNCCKIYKSLVLIWFSAIMIFLPMIVIQSIRPYQKHCMTKLDRTDTELSAWCLTSWPNVYEFIQGTYWQNKFLGIFDRKFEQILSSIPMFMILFMFTFTFCKFQIQKTVEYFSGQKVLSKSSSSESLMTQERTLPHFAYFAASVLVCLLFANAEINSRMASVCPMYYWLVGDLLARQNKGATFLGWLIVMHNLGFMCLNFVLFTMEIGFL